MHLGNKPARKSQTQHHNKDVALQWHLVYPFASNRQQQGAGHVNTTPLGVAHGKVLLNGVAKYADKIGLPKRRCKSRYQAKKYKASMIFLIIIRMRLISCLKISNGLTYTGKLNSVIPLRQLGWHCLLLQWYQYTNGAP